MVSPLIKKALSCILSHIVEKLNVVTGNIAGSGLNLTVVPVLFVVPTFFKGTTTLPPFSNFI